MSFNDGYNDQISVSASGSQTRIFVNGDATASVAATGLEELIFNLDYSDNFQITTALAGVTSITANGAGTNQNKTIDASGLGAGTSATLIGGSGDDAIIGGAGSDVLTGGQGLDTLNGGAGSNTVDYAAEGGASGVIVNLSAQSVIAGPTVLAGTARDTFGDTDTLSNIQNVKTGAGADTVVGSAAVNVIETGAGNDTITTGSGSDVLVFRSGFGADTVTDFATGAFSSGNFGADTDVLRFDAAVFATAQDVLAAAAQSGSDVIITHSAGNTITLKNVNLADLSVASIDIIGVNDAPTLRKGAPTATLIEAGHQVTAPPHRAWPSSRPTWTDRSAMTRPRSARLDGPRPRPESGPRAAPTALRRSIPPPTASPITSTTRAPRPRRSRSAM